MNYRQSLSSLKRIYTLKSQLDYCQNKIKKNIDNVNGLINDFPKIPQADQTLYKKLIVQKDEYLASVYYWKVLAYQLNQFQAMAIKFESKNNYENLTIKTNSVWENVALPLYAHFSPTIFYKNSGIKELKDHYYLTITVLIALIFLSIYLYAGNLAWLNKWPLPKRLFPKKISKKYQLILPLGLLCLYLHGFFYYTYPIPIILNVCTALFCYAVIDLFIYLDLSITSKKPLWPQSVYVYSGATLILTWLFQFSMSTDFRITKYYPIEYLDLRLPIAFLIFSKIMSAIISRNRASTRGQIITIMLKRFHVVTAVLLFIWISDAMVQGQLINKPFIDLQQCFYISLFNLSLFWLIWPAFKNQIFQRIFTTYQLYYVKLIIGFIFLLITAAAWIGYLHLALLLLPHLLATFILFLIFKDVNQLLEYLYLNISLPNKPLSKKIHSLLKLKYSDKLIEIYLIRLLYIIPIIFFLFICCLEIWGTSFYLIEALLIKIENGVKFVNTTIHLQVFIRASILLAILMLLGRILASNIAQSNLFSGEKHTQLMAFSIVKYSSFLLALLLCLHITGISLNNIFLLSGALSVGVGFGLQRFASDFISGLFLIVNKPVKIGDHIIVNDVEGYVRHIRSLSTQITGTNNADIIIPNSTLITSSITNLTFNSNTTYRLAINITLTDVTQLEKARSLLMQIAKTNKDVLQESPFQPRTIIELNKIILTCFIQDVNNKDYILSNLNLEINKQFAEINIAFTV